MGVKDLLLKFWAFLHDDSWASLVVTLILAIIIIKFIFFPLLSFLTGTPLPLVIVESCSMYHHNGFEKILESEIYKDNDIYLKDTENWVFQNGFSKGDIIFVVGAKNIEVGDVIIFEANQKYPLIHRVIRAEETYGTKGDNYITNPKQLISEIGIGKERIIGKALFRIPYMGWTKLIFFEFARPASERGFCFNQKI